MDEVDSEKVSIEDETCCSPVSAIDGDAGDLSRHQEVMHRLSLSIEEQQTRERRSLLQSRAPASSSSPERMTISDRKSRLYTEEPMDKSKNEAYSETEPLFQRRGDTLYFGTVIEKGAYGLGLDLAKAPDGGTTFLQYKAVSAAQGGPNLALKAVPTLLKGDRIVGVNGERWETFSETVKALRSSRGAEVQLDLERIA